MRLPAIPLLLFATIAGSAAGADGPGMSPAFAACMEASGGVNAAMHDCIATELRAQDARLNRAYKALGDAVGADRRKTLVAAQRLWLQYRDANCRFYGDPDGGTNAILSASDCVLRETALRARELEDLRPEP